MIHSILGTQQMRSQSLAKIKKVSIDKSKNEQSFRRAAILQEANRNTNTYTEFEKEAIEKMR